MPTDKQELWVTEIAEALRALPEEWDDRHGRAFDCLSSDKRAAIQRSRIECLQTAGSLVVRAILDFGRLSDCRFAQLHDRAAWARETERTKPFRRAAMAFFGMFIQWFCEHTDQLSPDMPVLSPLDCHLVDFRPEGVAREDFARNCQAIARLISVTSPRDNAAAQRPDDRRKDNKALTAKALSRTKAEAKLLALQNNEMAGTKSSEEPLGERAQHVLVAMLELGAVDSDRRRSTEKIVIKALGQSADANALKSVMAELKTRRLIDTRTGRGGGCWLTDSGRLRAEKLRRPDRNSATV